MPDGGRLYEIEYDVAADKLILRSMYAQALEDYPEAMAAVIDKLMEIKRIPRLVVTAEAREYEYSYEEAKMFYEIADAIMTIRSREIVSLPNLLYNPVCEVIMPGKFGFVQKIVYDLKYDPVSGYKRLLHEIRHVKLKLRKLKINEAIAEMSALPQELCFQCLEHYLASTLLPIREVLEKCSIIQKARELRIKGRDFYRRVFYPATRPTFKIGRAHV